MHPQERDQSSFLTGCLSFLCFCVFAVVHFVKSFKMVESPWSNAAQTLFRAKRSSLSSASGEIIARLHFLWQLTLPASALRQVIRRLLESLRSDVIYIKIKDSQWCSKSRNNDRYLLMLRPLRYPNSFKPKNRAIHFVINCRPTQKEKFQKINVFLLLG